MKEEKLTNKVKISKNEYHALIGIKFLSDKYESLLKELVLRTQEITGELNALGEPAKNDPYSGHCCDFVYGSRELDDMLRILKISVDE